jgi:hypothetical protein
MLTNISTYLIIPMIIVVMQIKIGRNTISLYMAGSIPFKSDDLMYAKMLMAMKQRVMLEPMHMKNSHICMSTVLLLYTQICLTLF